MNQKRKKLLIAVTDSDFSGAAIRNALLPGCPSPAERAAEAGIRP